MSDLLYTHNFYEPTEVVLNEADREIGFTILSNGGTTFERLPDKSYLQFDELVQDLKAIFQRYGLQSGHSSQEKYRWTLPP